MRTAAMNQEIKRVLTEVLLKVPVIVCFSGLESSGFVLSVHVA
jgi:hypothetical protein